MNTKKLMVSLLLMVALALPLAAQTATAPAAVATAAAQNDLIPALPAQKIKTPPANEQERIERQVRHELVMQPYYGLWDWLAFRVNGSTVELAGETHSLGLKSSAINVVKRIPGVTAVVDHVTELPPSSMDERIRHQVARAIFDWGSLGRYSWPTDAGIHIIVNSGRVTLEGVVSTQADKDAAFIRANGVSGVFQVTNNLRVVRG